ncbi:MAG: iron ABC transporter permease [Desulfobacula sp.]|uniref:ABC transporter permease n=1 Tax=Desulfobacula sp. TaxID=2593537 RepID=UPI0025C2B867|nr:iron ABC transporter permease [Desulfobacula sp.]MCD4721637.1 iron ABC transporter permease [Desulfobacula sp.]
MDGKNTSIKKRIHIHPYALAGLVPACFFLLFYFYPLSGIFMKSFFPKGKIDLFFLDQVFSSTRMIKIIWFTFWQAGLSTLLTLVCALPCAFVLSHYAFKGKKIIKILASIPFVLPAIVVATSLQACFGKNGVFFGVRLDHPLALILLAHIFYNFSVMLRIITGFWSSLQGRIREAAMVLGAGPWQVFLTITLPLLKPAIFAASILVFIFCFSSFGIVLILGGPSFSTIETEIYRQAAHLFNLPLASFLSLIQIGFTFALMWFYTSFTKRAVRFSPDAEQANLRKPVHLWEKMIIAGVVLFIILLCVVPLLALVMKSLTYNGEISLIFYTALFENRSDSIFYIPPFHAIKYSFLFAGGALIIAIITGVCAAFFIRFCDRNINNRLTSFFDPIFMLPLSTSAVTLGFGIIITLDKPPLNLRTSIFLIPIAHALVGFPFVLRSILPALRSIPEQLSDAASVLGASPLKIFRAVDLPLISKALVAGAIFAFTISLGEFGATIFTARPETPTIPVAIYRFLGQPGAMNYGQAMAISTLLMIVTAMGFVVIENFRIGNSEGF